jgi:integrase/recombinase XerC
LVLKTLYELGLRRSELVNLRVGQLDFSQQSIRVIGKGHKERILPVSHELLALFKNYLDKRANIPALSSEFVLVHENGLAVTPQWVYHTVKKYLSAVTSQDKKSPHVLRHSFATHLTNNGADLNAVKELLGHSSLAATQVYTHNSIDKLKKVHGQAHPRG